MLDGPYSDFSNPEGFAAECRQAIDLGFDGKTLIHPDQIAPANEAFAPGAEEVARARRLTAAYADAAAAGKGAIRFEGRLVEALHVAEARRLIALADAIAAKPAG
jgi:citrate lyase subunit beta/citryl-CoA lyase